MDSPEVVVQQMLVIDLIESQVLDNLLHVEKLNDKYAVRLQALSNAVCHRVQFLQVEEHSGSIDDVELSIQGTGDSIVEKRMNRIDAISICDRRRRRGRFNSKHGISKRLEMRQLR